MSDVTELSYREGMFARQRYVLTENYVEITLKSPARTVEGSVPLEQMKPSPVRWKTRPTNCLWIAAVLTLVAGGAVALSLSDPVVPERAVDLSIFAGVLFFGAAVFVFAFFRRVSDELLFVAADNSVVLSLSHNQPDPATFEEFVRELRSRIRQRRRQQQDLLRAPVILELAELLANHRVTPEQLREAKEELVNPSP